MKPTNTSIVWFRRDLRLNDNISLWSAVNLGAYIQPIFIFDTEILKRFTNKQDKRIIFITDALYEIEEKIKRKGGRLLVYHGNARKLVPQIAIELGVKTIFAGLDYEPYSKERDLYITNYLKKYDIKLILQNDHLLIAPEEVLKDDHKPYKVFTPYSHKWYKTLTLKGIKNLKNQLKEKYLGEIPYSNIKPLDLSKGPTALLEQIEYKYLSSSQWPIKDSVSNLDNFIEDKINDYKIKRDFMFMHSTSKLSPYIRFGILSIRECYQKAIEKEGSTSWINELIWRDFYTSILHYFPDTIHQEFSPEYRNLEWVSNPDHFKKWQQGLTGFPIVDAAMRQLKEEGWMHNRARMIVASFLTKDLLIDWRLGEEHFAQLLMDYELSSNVGGWQWSASVGTDAQPYFRIFNPIIQSKKFDPEGLYIKKYLPELQHVPLKYIHEPKKYDGFLSYPSPIVNHEQMRKKAIELFGRCKKIKI